jgi:alcohol dehydrogenase class IV
MWYFVAPQIVFGEGALMALDDLEGRQAFVVTDEILVRLGLVDKVTGRLEKAGLKVTLFDRVEPDPSLETVKQGAALALEAEPDWIVGVGGGSVLDAAKAIWILYERPDMQPEEINPIVTLGLRKKARLITVPTTSGTGAEVTWAIVLTDTEAQRKLSLGNREAVADLAIVDPEMVMDMPPSLTADTGLDALTHAVEGYTCAWHTDMTDGICLQAVRMIVEYLPRAVADGHDAVARERMHNAATLAGLGFGNAMACMAHAAGHALGARFHIPHGRAVGLMLPYTIEFIAAEAPERYAEVARALGCELEDDEAAARWLARFLREFSGALGLPTSLAELGIASGAYHESIDTLVDNAFNDASIMTAARPPSYEELQALLEAAYDGKPVDF